MKKMLTLFLVCCLLFVCTGCDTTAMFNNYPPDKASRWICEDPNMEILFAANEFGGMEVQFYQMDWDGKQIPVGVAFQAGYYVLFTDNGDNIMQEEEILASGDWHYRWGKLVLKISTDNFFDGKYQELVFDPQK